MTVYLIRVAGWMRVCLLYHGHYSSASAVFMAIGPLHPFGAASCLSTAGVRGGRGVGSDDWGAHAAGAGGSLGQLLCQTPVSAP